jgi:LacI family gluconate utilization system Gnt-I transcriptional repressor
MSRIAMMTGRVRLADVAAAAGVSAMTVSRALREPDRLHPDTLKRIRAKIRELGYLPNQSARSLASRRSSIVGAIVPTLANSVYAGTLQGMSNALNRFGFELMLAHTGYDIKHEHALVRAFIGRGVDALVLTGVEHERATRELVRAHRLPVAEIWDLGSRPLGLAIGFSNHGAGEAVGQFLHALGRRRWGFIGSPPVKELRSQKRMDGLRGAAEAAGLPPPECAFVHNGMSFDEALGAAASLLGEKRLARGLLRQRRDRLRGAQACPRTRHPRARRPRGGGIRRLRRRGHGVPGAHHRAGARVPDG